MRALDWICQGAQGCVSRLRRRLRLIRFPFWHRYGQCVLCWRHLPSAGIPVCGQCIVERQ